MLFRASELAAPSIAVLLLVSSTAFATPDQPGEARRTSLYEEGKALADAGRWAEARNKFREVVALRSTAKALMVLGVAEERLGALLDAKGVYERALAAARTSGSDEDRTAAERSVHALARRIPRIALKLPADVVPSRVTVDGRAAELDGPDVLVDPGDRIVLVESAGRLPFRVTVAIAESQRIELDVAMSRAPAAAHRGPPVATIVLGSVGAAATGTAFALWAVGKGEEASLVRTDCPAYRCTAAKRAALMPRVDAASEKIIAGDVLLGAGVAVIAAGAVVWALRRPATSPVRATTHWLVAATPDGARVVAWGLF